MPLNVMLHDSVISVGVNANIRFMGEAVIHYITEDTMYVRIAGDTMNHMIRPSTMPSRVGIAINFIILLFFICKGTHYSLFFRIFAAIFRIVYDERQNYIGIVEHIHDAHVKYIAS